MLWAAAALAVAAIVATAWPIVATHVRRERAWRKHRRPRRRL